MQRSLLLFFVLPLLVRHADAHGRPPDPGVTARGSMWCVRAEGATYAEPPNDALFIASADGAAPEGCRLVVAPSPVHDWIEAHATFGRVVIERNVLQLELGTESPLARALLETRDAIYADAVRACVELVPPTATSHTCRDPARFDMDPATPMLEPREIHRPRRIPRGAERAMDGPARRSLAPR